MAHDIKRSKSKVVVEFDCPKIVSSLLSEYSSDIQSTILGTYDDGEPRSLIDAIKGEYLSPAQKKKILKKYLKKKVKKYGKKHKKH